MSKKLSVVIPTKNREIDLATLVDSILIQSRMPDELIVIDQSDTSISKDNISEKWLAITGCDLKYILDPKIKGLVDAKRAGSEASSYEIVCFLDDDLILDSQFLEEIIKPFENDSSIRGCSGVFINFPRTSKLYQKMYSLFHRGIFSDPRPAVFKKYHGYKNALFESSVLWGGITAWRSDVLQRVPFDAQNSLFMMEDFDYSRKVVEALGDGLFLNPNARAIHNHSEINRASEKEQEKRKIFEYLAFYKKWKHQSNSLIPFRWLFIGLFLHALYQSVRQRDMGLLTAFMEGIRMSNSRDHSAQVVDIA